MKRASPLRCASSPAGSGANYAGCCLSSLLMRHVRVNRDQRVSRPSRSSLARRRDLWTEECRKHDEKFHLCESLVIEFLNPPSSSCRCVHRWRTFTQCRQPHQGSPTGGCFLRKDFQRGLDLRCTCGSASSRTGSQRWFVRFSAQRNARRAGGGRGGALHYSLKLFSTVQRECRPLGDSC